jgi:hypothetical protein
MFFSANPPETARLDLDREISKIEEGWQRSKLRDQFQLVSKWAVDSNSLRRALLEENSDIVHFPGHGGGEAGLLLVGQDRKPKPATAEALCGLFEHFPNIKCVLLNVCYAEVQAKAIVQHIDYVIGMKQAVRDDAAIAFAPGFYDDLGYGKSIDVAFLADLKLSQIKKFQLAILANVLGVSEADANQILQKELEKRQHNAQSIARELEQERPSVSNTLPNSSATVTKQNTQEQKKIVSVVSVVATFIVLIAGVTSFLKSLDYSILKNYLNLKDWESTDDESRLLMLKAVDRNEDDWIRNK